MKYLLLLLALLAAVFWYLGAGRRARRSARPPSPAPALKAVEMVRCAHCGLHLPRGEALTARSGVFCDAAHREAFEAAHPGDRAA